MHCMHAHSLPAVNAHIAPLCAFAGVNRHLERVYDGLSGLVRRWGGGDTFLSTNIGCHAISAKYTTK